MFRQMASGSAASQRKQKSTPGAPGRRGSKWRRLHQPREVMGGAKYEDRILSSSPAKSQKERRVVLVINWINGLFFLKKSIYENDIIRKGLSK